jgi:hypothetical protein
MAICHLSVHRALKPCEFIQQLIFTPLVRQIKLYFFTFGCSVQTDVGIPVDDSFHSNELRPEQRSDKPGS